MYFILIAHPMWSSHISNMASGYHIGWCSFGWRYTLSISMDSFPVAEVTNCHTLGCLKQQKCFVFFFSLILLQAKSPKLRCQQGHTSREISKGHSVLCLFQVLVAPSIPLACVASTLICLHFHFASSSSICIKSLLSLLQRQLSLKLGPT